MRLRLNKVKTMNYSFAGEVRVETIKLFNKMNELLNL